MWSLYIMQLDDSEITFLVNLTKKIESSPSAEPIPFLREIRACIARLPPKFQTEAKLFSEKGSSTGTFLISIRSWDGDNIPPTPDENDQHVGETTTLTKIQAMFASIMGTLIAYEPEGNGKLFQDIIPNYKLSKSQTSLGANTELEIHTEQAFTPLRPDILSLACLRGDPDAKTYTLHVKTLMDQLTAEKQALLRTPLWTIGVDLSFRIGGASSAPRGPMPILYGDADDPFLVFDQDLMRGITEEAEQLRKEIIDMYYQHRSFHVLSAGEILFLDNKRVVHGRSPFRPRYDGTDRFLVRCFITKDYKKSEYARPDGGAVIASEYI